MEGTSSAGRLDDQVFVRNLSYDTTDEDLMALFEPFGPIKRAAVAKGKDSNVSRGFGFVAFALGADAATAVKSLQGKSLKGRAIKVELAAKRGQVVDEKPEAGLGARDEAERARHEARRARALRSKGAAPQEEHAEPAAVEEDTKGVAGDSAADASQGTGSNRIAHPSGVRPGLVLLLFGVPAALKKRDLLTVVKKKCRKVQVELVKDGHYLLESLAAVYPAGKVFELVAPSRQDCSKLVAALNGISPQSLGLRASASADGDSDDDAHAADSATPKDWKDKMYVRTLAELTQPQFRKRHCRLIVRNLSFQATELNIADKLGRFGPLAEVAMPVTEVSSEGGGKEKTRRRGKVGPRLRPKGFAFVTFLCDADARAAVSGSAPVAGPVLKICNREVAVDFCQAKDRFLEGPAEGAAAVEEEPAIPEQMDVEDDGDGDAAGSGIDDNEDSDNSDVSNSDGEDDDEDAEEEDAESKVADTKAPASKEKGDAEDDVAEGRTVFLRGLSLDAEVRDVKRALNLFGKIEMAVLVKDKKTGEARGTAFAKFSKAAEAQACVAASKHGVGLVVADRACVVDLAVARPEAERLKNEGKGRLDRRHLYLANEGLAMGTADDVAVMPEEEKEKRRMAQAEKKKKLVNPLYAVSSLRLSVRNLHKGVTDVQLRDLCTAATQLGLKRSLAGKTDLEKLLAADGQPATLKSLSVPDFGKGGKRHMPTCRVMLDLVRVRGGLPQSRGYGFVEFKSHVHAVACLRELNQNKKYSSSAIGLPASATKEGAALRSTLIVEFALENMQKVKILQDRIARQVGQPNVDANSDSTELKKRPRTDSAEEPNEENDSGEDSGSDGDAGSNSDSDPEEEDAGVSSSGKSQTPAAKRRRQDQRRREKQGRRLRRKEELTATGALIPDAPAKTEKKRGGLFSRIRDKKKAKLDSRASSS